MAANPEIERYIYDAAVKRSIDPAVALEVARREALNVFDPNKPDYGGDDRSSFGVFQLHYGGLSSKMPNAGLGDEFTSKTGLDARDPNTWRQQVDFSLDYARQNGWGSWMGAKAAGITGMMGIGGTPAGSRTAAATTSPSGVTPSYAAAAAPPIAVPEDQYSSPLADVVSSHVVERPLSDGVVDATEGRGPPSPAFDFASAIPQPPPVPAAPTPLAAAGVTPDGSLAELFKVKDYGQPTKIDPRTQVPVTRRTLV